MSAASHFLSSQKDIELARKSLERDGCFLIHGVYTPEECAKFRSFIDSYSNNDVEVNYKGTETRIWDAQAKRPELNDFYERCHRTVEAVVSTPVKAKTLLAIRNRPVDTSDPELQLGRWHLDSFFKQFKIFLFLTDTTEESGPFEFLPRTHAEAFKYKMLLTGSYVKPLDLIKKNRSYQSLNESLVDRLAGKGFRPTPVICKAGTAMIVNTSAIHRARPCLKDARYALTTYYY